MPDYPEVQEASKKLHAFVNDLKKQIKDAGYVGVVMIGNAAKISIEKLPEKEKIKCLLQVVTGKTMIAPFTMFYETEDSPMELNHDAGRFEANASIHMVRSFIESMEDEMHHHKNLLIGMQLHKFMQTILEDE
jgi:hypothetical protein